MTSKRQRISRLAKFKSGNANRVDDRFPNEDPNSVRDRSALQNLLNKETFAGVKEIIENKNEKNASFIFIIKNIKSFNHLVLNELIHLVKKYRQPSSNEYGTSDGLNLCLILGV